MKDKNILSLDLEYNQPSQTIIQVGYVIGNMATGDILERVRRYVKIDETIDPRIVKLTSVTDKLCLEQGLPLEEIYDEMIELHTKHDCFRNAITWGGGDSADLRNALGMNEERFLLGRRWIDAKTVFITHQWAHGMSERSGLAKSMTKVGLNFVGKKHDALDDAFNTFVMYRELTERYRRINA